MNTSDSAPVLAGMPHGALQRQLFRYAQDLQELLDQQSRMQQQYKVVLEFIGHEVPDEDWMATSLCQATGTYLQTDIIGSITDISVGARDLLHLRHASAIGSLLEHVVSASSERVVRCVLDKFATPQAGGGIDFRRLEVEPTNGTRTSIALDTLVLQTRATDGSKRLHWLFRASEAVDQSLTATVGAFVQACQGRRAMMLTDAQGTICGVNSAMVQVTGYSASEMLGHNPRLFGSGHHQNAFFQDFWHSLLDQGVWNGHMLNRRKNGQVFLAWQSIKMIEDSGGKVVGYLGSIKDLSLKSDSKQLAVDLAYRDPVSGLYNRRRLEAQVEQEIECASRSGDTFSLMFLNLDGLKRISGDMGYDVADQVRQQVGLRFKAMRRPNLLVAQLGSDDIALLLTGSPSEEEVGHVANAVLALLVMPYDVGPKGLHISGNIGCAMFPRDGADFKTLLCHADAAMFGASQFATHLSFYETEDSEASDISSSN